MLRRYTWEKAREKLQHYRRRSPEASPLYQIVYHSRDDLQFQWESRLFVSVAGLLENPWSIDWLSSSLKQAESRAAEIIKKLE
jgi:hypothetical protein